MNRTAKRIAAAALFVFGVAAGLTPTKTATAEEAEGSLQCWYFWWQDPGCTFCVSGCFGSGWDCCTTPAET